MDRKNTLPSDKSSKRSQFSIQDCERVVQEFQKCPCKKNMNKLLGELNNAVEEVLRSKEYNERNVKNSKNQIATYRQQMTSNFVRSISENAVNQNSLSKSKSKPEDFGSFECKPDENSEFSMPSPYPLEFEDEVGVCGSRDSISSNGAEHGCDADSEYESDSSESI